MSATAGAAQRMPHGISNIYIYDTFNAMSWNAALGVPMLLFLQHLGASATVIACVACLSPLLNILQIPSARYVERVGYRRFVLSGWTPRSFMIVGMAIITFLPDSVDRTTRIVAILMLSFAYNTLRGISLCGLLPWFTHIVPEELRGEFLSRDQVAIALSSIFSLTLYGWILSGQLAWYSFGIVFTIASAAAFISLNFLRRVPDVPVEKIVSNPEPLPWGEMLFFPPFFKYIRYVVIINLAQGASTVFWVRFFRTSLHLSASFTLLTSAFTTVILAGTLFLAAPLIDRAGNKPALTVSGLLLALNFTGWALVATRIIPFSLGILFVQCLTGGMGNALWGMANVRCVMGIVPEMGRPHFLALYSVASNLALGLAPLAWGPLMDALADWHHPWGGWNFNVFTLFYLVLLLTIALGIAVLQRVTEPATMSWNSFMHELLVKTPSRALSRAVGRMRGPFIG